MVAATSDLWGGLALLALLAMVAALLWGVFRSTGKKPIRRSLRPDDNDPLGGSGMLRGSVSGSGSGTSSSEAGGDGDGGGTD
ncbi:MAG: hypothetical protein U1E49_11390 [Hyphomicrobiaceae bacterium]